MTLTFSPNVFWLFEQNFVRTLLGEGAPCPRGEMAAILRGWNRMFLLFSEPFLVFPTKLGRDIARGNDHLVPQVDLKRPCPWEMGAIFRIWNHIFSLFSWSVFVIPTKLSRDIARGKRHLVREFYLKRPWPGEVAAILRSEIKFLHFSLGVFWLFQWNMVRSLLGVRGTLSVNFTSNDIALGKWWPFLRSGTTFLHFSPNII